MHAFFAYGTLMIDKIMERVTGRTLRHAPAVLLDHVRYRFRNATYPGIIGKEGTVVQGRLYYNVDNDALARLDAFEGDAYEKILLQVIDHEGRYHEAFTYRVKDDVAHLLIEEEWDIAEFKEEDMLCFMSELDN